MENNGIKLNLENYISLSDAYKKAVADGKKGDDVIIWEGKELLVSYLFYILAYFEMFEEIGNYAIKHKITRERT